MVCYASRFTNFKTEKKKERKLKERKGKSCTIVFPCLAFGAVLWWNNYQEIPLQKMETSQKNKWRKICAEKCHQSTEHYLLFILTSVKVSNTTLLYFFCLLKIIIIKFVWKEIIEHVEVNFSKLLDQMSTWECVFLGN